MTGIAVVTLQVLTIVLGIILANYAKIDSYTDKRRKGFWKALKPQGKYIVIMGITLLLLQMGVYLLNMKERGALGETITRLERKLNDLESVTAADFESNGPQILMDEIVITDTGLSLSLENTGHRIADSVQIVFCVFGTDSTFKKIGEEMCNDSDGKRLAVNESVFPGKTLAISFPFTVANLDKPYGNVAIVGEVSISYVDDAADKRLSDRKMFVWEGIPKSGLALKPAPQIFYDKF